MASIKSHTGSPVENKHAVRRVVIVDDTLCHNASVLRRDGAGFVRLLMVKHNRGDTVELPVGERKFGHRQAQHTVRVERVLEGRHLEHALRRARRWMRRPRRGGAPRHIALFLAALHRTDPAGFEEAMRRTNAMRRVL